MKTQTKMIVYKLYDFLWIWQFYSVSGKMYLRNFQGYLNIFIFRKSYEILNYGVSLCIWILYNYEIKINYNKFKVNVIDTKVRDNVSSISNSNLLMHMHIYIYVI